MITHAAVPAELCPARRDSHVRAGVVTPAEAKQILSRYNASHFRSPEREHARYSIPANPLRDDDIRLGAFIANSEELVDAARALFEPAFLESAAHELPPTDRPFARFLRALQRFEERR